MTFFLFRHCERSAAIHLYTEVLFCIKKAWIASSKTPRIDVLFCFVIASEARQSIFMMKCCGALIMHGLLRRRLLAMTFFLFRHCERSAAIYLYAEVLWCINNAWIASSKTPRNDVLFVPSLRAKRGNPSLC
jgi:hypothetical protein